MSSWVVPTIAAEVWNVPVETILDCIGDGSLESRSDGAFIFVDIGPANHLIVERKLITEGMPATYRVLTTKEMAALHGLSGETADESARPDVSQWRVVRRQVSRTRRGPGMLAA